MPEPTTDQDLDFDSMDEGASDVSFAEEPSSEGGDQHPQQEGDKGTTVTEPGGTDPGTGDDGGADGNGADDLPAEADDGQRVLDKDGAVMLRQDGKWIPERTVADFHLAEDMVDDKGKVLLEAGDYSRDDVLEGLYDRQNRKAWQKTNTERAMDLKAAANSVEKVGDFLKKLKAGAFAEDGKWNEKSLASGIYNGILEDDGKEAAEEFKALLEYDPSGYEDPRAAELETVTAELDEYRAKEAVDLAKIDLVKTVEKEYGVKLTPEEQNEVVAHGAEKLAQGIEMDLLTAYRDLNFDKVRTGKLKNDRKQEEKNRRQPQLPRKGTGAAITGGEKLEDWDDLDQFESLEFSG